MHAGLEILVARRAGRVRQIVVERQVGIDENFFSSSHMCLNRLYYRIRRGHTHHTSTGPDLIARVQGAQERRGREQQERSQDISNEERSDSPEQQPGNVSSINKKKKKKKYG